MEELLFLKICTFLAINEKALVNATVLEENERLSRIYDIIKSKLDRDNKLKVVKTPKPPQPTPKKQQEKQQAPPRRKILSSPAKIVRPEDRGVDFNQFSTKELLQRMRALDFSIYNENPNAKDTISIDMRKAAQVIGDRYVSGEFVPTSKQKQIINNLVDQYYQLWIGASNSDDEKEARCQIIRLWKIGIPTILEYVEHEDWQVFTATADLLIELQDKRVIEQLIENAKNVKDEAILERYHRVLFHMKWGATNGCRTFPKNRPCLNPEEVMKNYNTLVIPFLEEMDNKKNE